MFKLSSDQIAFRWLLPIPIILIIYALILTPIGDLILNTHTMLLNHQPGIHDYHASAGLSTALFNVGVVGLIVMGLLKYFKLTLNANGISALFIMMGFAFIGKNFLNIIPFIVGGYLYAKFQKIPFKRVLVASLLASCLAPLVEFTLLTLPYNFAAKYAISMLVGIVISLIAIPIASHILLTHQGYNLYNMGYAAGFIGIISVAVLRGFGLEIEKFALVTEIENTKLIWLLLLFNVYYIVLGILSKNARNKPYKTIYFYSGRLVTDFTRVMGPGTTMINMGVMGSIAILFVLVFQASISGPVVAGIFTLTGFSSFGNHPKNTLPIMIGAVLGILFINHNLTISSGMVAVLFSTTLAPIAGEYGLFAGLFAGVMHSILVSSMASLHAGMNLYNNGFSGGLIAMLLVPIIDAYKEDKNAPRK